MDRGDIERLFESILDDPAQDDEGVREVFAVLVRTTLRYRDRLLSSEGVVVTVEDVRAALGWLVPALATGNLPEPDGKLRLALLKEWLEALQKANLSGPR